MGAEYVLVCEKCKKKSEVAFKYYRHLMGNKEDSQLLLCFLAKHEFCEPLDKTDEQYLWENKEIIVGDGLCHKKWDPELKKSVFVYCKEHEYLEDKQ